MLSDSVYYNIPVSLLFHPRFIALYPINRTGPSEDFLAHPSTWCSYLRHGFPLSQVGKALHKLAILSTGFFLSFLS